MNQLKLIARLEVDNICNSDNFSMVEYIYKESFKQLNNTSDKLIRTSGEHPLSLICKSIENTFRVNGEIYIDTELDTAVIELYSFDETGELTISRAVDRLYLLIDKLLHGAIRVF